MSIVKHIRNYASAGLIGSVAGLLSFPILTRSLSVEDYGLLGLVISSIGIAASIGKFGLQHALLRYYGAADVEGEEARSKLLSTMLSALVSLSLIGVVLWLLYSILVVPQIVSATKMVSLCLLATVLIPLRVVGSGFINLLRADQRSAIVGTTQASEKLLRVGIVSFIALMFTLSVEIVIGISILSELLIFVWLCYWVWPYLRSVKWVVPGAALYPFVVYGLPSMANEVAHTLLQTGDRYVIESLLGGDSLGHYAAASNMCMYLEWVLIAAIDSAMIPHYIRIFEREGADKTTEFVSKALSIYLMVSCGVFAIFCAVAPSLLLFLAGDRYAEGVVVVPWVAGGLIFSGTLTLIGAGAIVRKKPMVPLKWTAIAVVCNILLNILLVPYFGLIAAAAVTLAMFALMGVGIYWDNRELLHVDIPYQVLLRSVPCAGFAWWMGTVVPTPGHFEQMFVGGAMSTIAYIVSMSLLSPEFRTQGLSILKLLQSRLFNR